MEGRGNRQRVGMTSKQFVRATGCIVVDVSQDYGSCSLLAYDAETHLKIAGVTHRKESVAYRMLAEKVFAVNGDAVIKKQKGRCAQCGERKPLSGHHKVHRSKQLDHRQGNLEGLCQACHGTHHGQLHHEHGKGQPNRRPGPVSE